MRSPWRMVQGTFGSPRPSARPGSGPVRSSRAGRPSVCALVAMISAVRRRSARRGVLLPDEFGVDDLDLALLFFPLSLLVGGAGGQVDHPGAWHLGGDRQVGDGVALQRQGVL